MLDSLPAATAASREVTAAVVAIVAQLQQAFATAKDEQTGHGNYSLIAIDAAVNHT